VDKDGTKKKRVAYRSEGNIQIPPLNKGTEQQSKGQNARHKPTIRHQGKHKKVAADDEQVGHKPPSKCEGIVKWHNKKRPVVRLEYLAPLFVGRICEYRHILPITNIGIYSVKAVIFLSYRKLSINIPFV
jgi:hypothetical protein